MGEGPAHADAMAPLVQAESSAELVETVASPFAADPFGDLQPMLDLRFPEEPAAAENVASDESVVPATRADATDVEVLTGEIAASQESEFDDAGNLPAEIPVEPIEAAAVVPADAVDHADHVPASDESAAEDGDAEPAPDQSEPSVTAGEVDAGPAEQHPPDLDAERQIANEADATAQALETLKQLIAHKLPNIEIAPLAASMDEEAKVLPPPIQVFTASHAQPGREPGPDTDPEPIDLPSIVSEYRHAGRGPAWQGFFAGFMASWAIGAALYAYLVFA
jgi:hypothetical protein